jgi:hypothetical protein
MEQKIKHEVIFSSNLSFLVTSKIWENRWMIVWKAWKSQINSNWRKSGHPATETFKVSQKLFYFHWNLGFTKIVIVAKRGPPAFRPFSRYVLIYTILLSFIKKSVFFGADKSKSTANSSFSRSRAIYFWMNDLENNGCHTRTRHSFLLIDHFANVVIFRLRAHYYIREEKVIFFWSFFNCSFVNS